MNELDKNENENENENEKYKNLLTLTEIEHKDKASELEKIVIEAIFITLPNSELLRRTRDLSQAALQVFEDLSKYQENNDITIIKEASMALQEDIEMLYYFRNTGEKVIKT